MRRFITDIAVYGQNGQLQLLVEVKSKHSGSSPEWAAKLVRNMYAHGQLPQVPFFLLVLPDYFYLWKDIKKTDEPTQPHYRGDAYPLLGTYFESSKVSMAHVTEQSLELAVSMWLEKLVRGYYDPSGSASGMWLYDSGLLDTIKNGSVRVEEAFV